MSYLAKIRRICGIKKDTQNVFRGIDRRTFADEGSICDTDNIDFRAEPELRSQCGKRKLLTLTSPYMLCRHDGKLFYADGDTLYCDGAAKGTVSRSEKQFCSFGKKLLIFPDKLYYDSESGTLGSLECSYGGSAVFGSGTIYGEAAENNTVTLSSACGFSVGDAVSFGGCTHGTANNGLTLIIREISDDKKTLSFYENSFEPCTESNVTIARTVPDLDFVCVNENRVWGCKDSMIYASRLGDAFNWNAFDGLSSDSYAIAVNSKGDFTGCTSYLGYPLFFKENAIYKMYGSRPSNYELLSSATLGVKKGSSKTLATASEKLFYLSPSGFCVYSGGIPSLLEGKLGEGLYGGSACSDGINYFVSVMRGDASELFALSGRTKSWFRISDTDSIDMCCDDGILLALSSSGELYEYFGELGSDPDERSFSVYFSDMYGTYADCSKKYPIRLFMRYCLGSLSSVSFDIMYDKDGVWRSLGVFGSEGGEGVRTLSAVPRRCDSFRLRIRGTGDFTLKTLTRRYTLGSEK